MDVCSKKEVKVCFMFKVETQQHLNDTTVS